MPLLEPGRRETRINRLLAPRPVLLISTVSPAGSPNLAAFSFVMPVSYHPPMIGFSCGVQKHLRDRGFDPARHPETEETVKDTLVNIRAVADFVAHPVTVDLLPAVSVADRAWPYGVSEAARAGLTLTPGVRVRSPVIKEAKLALECRLSHTLDVGDSVLVVGTVVLVHAADAVLDEGKVDVLRGRAVAHTTDPEWFGELSGFVKAERRRYDLGDL